MYNARFFVVMMLSLAVLGGLTYFLYRRLVGDVTKSTRLRRAGAGLLIAMVALSLGARVIALILPGSGSRIFIMGLLGWMGFLLYATLLLILFEPIRWWDRRQDKKAGVENPARRELFAKIAAGSAVAGGVGLSAYGVYSAYTPPEITEVAVKLPNLPKALDGFTLVQLSDVHVGALIQQRFMADLVERVNAQKPDLVCITGDLVDGSVEHISRYVAEVQKLSSRYGTHFVTGNHDYYAGAEEWCDALSKMGLVVLRNRGVQIGDKDASFDLFGIDDPMGSTNGSNFEELNAALKGRDESRASVLMAHRPSDFSLALKKGIGLQLSGHTHGGQLFPGTLISDLIWGKRSHGYSKDGQSQLYVSRGCGFVGPPMRVGSAPELVKVILTSA
ncbi:MAG: metallophosphoesterase [Myxococcaceae bacterium]